MNELNMHGATFHSCGNVPGKASMIFLDPYHVSQIMFWLGEMESSYLKYQDAVASQEKCWRSMERCKVGSKRHNEHFANVRTFRNAATEARYAENFAREMAHRIVSDLRYDNSYEYGETAWGEALATLRKSGKLDTGVSLW